MLRRKIAGWAVACAARARVAQYRADGTFKASRMLFAVDAAFTALASKTAHGSAREAFAVDAKTEWERARFGARVATERARARNV